MEENYCFLCQEPKSVVGHATELCPDVKCRNCGQTGHILSNCSNLNHDSSKHLHLSREQADYPKNTDYLSKEDYDEAIKKFFKVKGLKHSDDFSDNEKKTIVEDCAIKLISHRVLRQKYNTMSHVICNFVRASGFSVAPNDLSEYLDYPKKSDDISLDEYKIITKKYLTEKRQEKEKAARELKVQKIIENLIPEDSTDHPNFPELLAGVTKEIDQYWINRGMETLKRKMSGFEPVQNSDLPKKRKIEDFSEEEQKIVFDERTLLPISKETVAERHKANIHVVDEIITNYNLKPRKNATLRQKMIKSDFEKRDLVEDSSVEMIGTFNCSICQVQCPCQTALADHLAGKKHKKLSQNTHGCQFRCDICNIETTSQYNLDQHLAGEKHRKRKLYSLAALQKRNQN